MAGTDFKRDGAGGDYGGVGPAASPAGSGDSVGASAVECPRVKDGAAPRTVDPHNCIVCGKANHSLIGASCGAAACINLVERGVHMANPNGTQKPALGHEFDVDLDCRYCGQSYYKHQLKPDLCERLAAIGWEPLE